MRTVRMIFLAIALAVSICITGGLAYAATVLKEKGTQHKTPPAFAPDQVIVAFKPGTPGEAKRAAHAQAGGRLIHMLDAIGAHIVGVPSGTVLDKIAVYKHNPNVRYAEPNHYRRLTVPPSECPDTDVCTTYWEEQWYLHNEGQSFQNDPYGTPCILTGVEDADIDWLEAYEAGYTGDPNITIAFVDSGIDAAHPDLASKIVELWNGPGVTGEGTEDNIGHGTHVVGLAAAGVNNGHGIAGIDPNAGIAMLKVARCTAWLFGQCLAYEILDSDVAAAILHAVDQGYQIINISLGGSEIGEAINDAISLAIGAGHIIVAGAGNDYLINPPNHFYPADCPGVISVGATDYFDNLASFSNFGPGVDVLAPGVGMLSTFPSWGCGGAPDCTNWMDGTSMATPVVSGAAAQVLASIAGPGPFVPTPALRDAVTNALLNNADHTGTLGQNFLAWSIHGRLNLYSALTGGGSFCGDGTCDPAEDPCTCSADCGESPEATCDDGVDNDCDGSTDCNDTNCASACCGNGTCDSIEDPCTCSADCGESPEATCDDGVDNDCDTLVDCDDTDCAGDPACQGCGNTLCEAGEDCNTCPSDCDGKQTGKPSNRFCCGNGSLEAAEGDGSICDGNP